MIDLSVFASQLALLSVRFSMDRLFKNFFPVWFDTSDGVSTLEARSGIARETDEHSPFRDSRAVQEHCDKP